MKSSACVRLLLVVKLLAMSAFLQLRFSVASPLHSATPFAASLQFRLDTVELLARLHGLGEFTEVGGLSQVKSDELVNQILDMRGARGMAHGNSWKRKTGS
jgi:hypothetical protein